MIHFTVTLDYPCIFFLKVFDNDKEIFAVFKDSFIDEGNFVTECMTIIDQCMNNRFFQSFTEDYVNKLIYCNINLTDSFVNECKIRQITIANLNKIINLIINKLNHKFPLIHINYNHKVKYNHCTLNIWLYTMLCISIILVLLFIWLF